MTSVYKCSCGFMEPSKPLFARHFGQLPKAEKPNHKSQGLVDIDSGEVLHANKEDEREQAKLETKAKREAAQGEKEAEKEIKKTPADNPAPRMPAGSPAPAGSALAPGQSANILPRPFTINTTIIWQAMQAAVREWGWDPNMPPGDFLDTIIYLAFKANGITLGGYSVEESGNGNGHNGRRAFTEDDVRVIAEKAVKEALAQVAGGKN